MTPDDHAQVYALWLSCAGMGLNDLDDSEEGLTRFLTRNPDTCFVWQAGENIVGVILSGNDGRRGYIYHLAVAPAYRRRGSARRLVETALSALRRQGIHKVALVVFERNESGNAFWESMGFTVRGDLCYRNKALVQMHRIDT